MISRIFRDVESGETNNESGTSDSVSRPSAPDSGTKESRNQKISEQYEKYLEQAKSERPEAPMSELALRAYELALKAREGDSDSTDTFARNVEHYALCRASAVSQNLAMIGYCGIGFTYDLLKALALGLKAQSLPALEKALRSNPERPISEPSWHVDYWRGLYDGWFKDNSGEPAPSRDSTFPKLP